MTSTRRFKVAPWLLVCALGPAQLGHAAELAKAPAPAQSSKPSTKATSLKSAQAAKGGKSDTKDFKLGTKLFEAAQESVRERHFQRAALRFQASYDVTKDPILLYNIGESWQKAGESARAVAAFKAYLAGSPKAADRAQVSKRVTELQSAKTALTSQSAPGDDPSTALTGLLPEPAPAVAAAPAPAATAPPPTTPKSAAASDAPPPPPAPFALKGDPFAAEQKAASPDSGVLAPGSEPAPAATAAAAAQPAAAGEASTEKAGLLDEAPVSKLRTGAWIGVAGTVALLSAGAIMGLSAQSRADEISRRLNFVDANGQPRLFDAMQKSEYDTLRSEGSTYQSASIALFALSGAAAVTSAVLFGLDHVRSTKKPDKAVRLLPAASPAGAALVAKWSY